jgi:hypothetical protein
MIKTLDQEELYNILHKSTGINFLQTTGLANDPSWTSGTTTHVIVWNEGVYQIPTYEQGLELVFNVKPKYGKGLNCNDHAFRDKVLCTDYCLENFNFTYPPAYGIVYVFPAFGRRVTHCANLFFHQTKDESQVVARLNDPQNTRSTFELDEFIVNEKSDVCTIPHFIVI